MTRQNDGQCVGDIGRRVHRCLPRRRPPFSTANLRVTAARSWGLTPSHIGSSHLWGHSTGEWRPASRKWSQGFKGRSSAIRQTIMNMSERRVGVYSTNQAVAALTPFVDITAAAKAGFDTNSSFQFVPFTPTAPSSWVSSSVFTDRACNKTLALLTTIGLAGFLLWALLIQSVCV